MLDSGSENAGVEVVTHVVLIVAMQLSPKEGGDILRLHGVDGGANERFIKSLQVCLFIEDDVRGIFRLHDAPTIGDTILCCNRTVALDEDVQCLMKLLDPDGVGQFLSHAEIINVQKSIILKDERDATL